ncbi:EGFR-like transmembrane domain-containing protein [Litchfieldia salsa]|uniref:DUF4129 domain-containing protein n=1 Tax=Litchfieldia salsa TaxID=930152 RepID=A0A1H0UUG3_9BACI|nr:transmembrane domain-containing protein [Litchfieldia salsa]SDP69558.1 hypothetical protein SAMN05216565_105159 [Litchfieldia salsa]
MLNSNDAKNDIENILEAKEYRMYQEESKSVLEILWDKVRDWIADLLSNMIPSVESSSNLASVVLSIVIFALVVGLVFFIALRVRNKKRKNGLQSYQPLQTINEMNWSYQQHLKEAQVQEGLKNYMLATRHMFLALLLYFHEQEWLIAKIWKTNWDYYEELLKINQMKAEKFYLLALLFDEVAYGEREVQSTDFLDYYDRVMKLFEEQDETTILKSRGEEG